MLRFDAWNMSALQDCLAVLNECDLKGVATVQEAKAVVVAYLHAETEKRLAEPANQGSAPVFVGTCPECGSDKLRQTAVEGEHIMTCVDCRWSVYLGENP
jgi:hypothetical protein